MCGLAVLDNGPLSICTSILASVGLKSSIFRDLLSLLQYREEMELFEEACLLLSDIMRAVYAKIKLHIGLWLLRRQVLSGGHIVGCTVFIVT